MNQLPAQPFNFLGQAFNQMLVNPRSPEKDKKDQAELKISFEQKYGDKNYFLVPSSGSSGSENTSVKLIALHRDAVMNSAARVNSFFKLNFEKQNLIFGSVLPLFHVAALGTYARAFLLKSTVVQSTWNAEQFAPWIDRHRINIVSLVPTQIFDLVEKNIQAPDSLQIVFIGSSKLDLELRQKAKALGWPLVETYGMTETASMIAVAQEKMEVFPEVEVAVSEQKLKIKCNSLMTCSVQKVNGEIQFKNLENGWLQTEDLVTITSEKEKYFLEFLGRASDFIKINGEGVSVSKLRDTFGAFNHLALMAIPEPRTGHEIVLVSELNPDEQSLSEAIKLFNNQVRPFEKIKKLYRISELPRTSLGKIKFKMLEEIIKGVNYENI